MKKTSKVLAIFMAVVSLAMPLAGCAKATGYEGRWIAWMAIC